MLRSPIVLLFTAFFLQLGSAKYVPDPQDSEILRICVNMYRKVGQYPDALRIAVRLGDGELIRAIYEACEDPVTRKQLAFMLARHKLFTAVEDETNGDILNHANLSESFLTLAKDLDILEPKTPEDIYKSSLSESTFSRCSYFFWLTPST